MSPESWIEGLSFQVLSRALGGKTGRSTVGWTLGLKEIPLSKALLEKPYGKLLPDTIRALGVHQDQVSEIPPGAELLASTERTRVEMFCIQSHVLAIQSHPEFTKDVVADLINKRLVNGIINVRKMVYFIFSYDIKNYVKFFPLIYSMKLQKLPLHRWKRQKLIEKRYNLCVKRS